MKDLVGRHGVYKVGKLLGGGGMAEVFRGKAKDGSAVAIKKPRMSLAPEHQALFLREAEAAMKVACDIARGFRPPAFLCQTDSVFACDDTAPGEHLCKKIVERVLDLFAHTGIAIVSVCHDVDVNVAVAGVTKAGDRESMFYLEPLREFHQVHKMTPRHDDVFVQFR